MNPELRRKLGAAREALRGSVDAVLAGEIRGPTKNLAKDILSGWEPYAEFLRVADGATLGGIDLWSSDEIPKKQYVSVDRPGQRWLVFGQLLYEPLALERGKGTVRLFRRDGDPEGEDLGDFDAFVGRLLGPGYATLVPDVEDDEWWSLLACAGLR